MLPIEAPLLRARGGTIVRELPSFYTISLVSSHLVSLHEVCEALGDSPQELFKMILLKCSQVYFASQP